MQYSDIFKPIGDSCPLKFSSDFNKEIIRSLSFTSWSDKNVSKQKLARYGFHYNLKSDHVKCYFCKVVFGEWGIGDDPLIEHHIRSPNCDFINMKPTNNIPIGDPTCLIKELNKLQPCIQFLNGDLFPRHPGFKNDKMRLKSYVRWPKCMSKMIKGLSVAGFFYLGIGDHGKCFFCGGCLKDWEETDNALEKHKNYFHDRCPFIKTNYKKLKVKYSNNCLSTDKASPAQLWELVKYMNDHPDLKNGKINLRSKKNIYNRMWEDLANHLNNIVGYCKSTSAWKKIWWNHHQLTRKSARTNQEIGQNDMNHSTIEPDTTNPQLQYYYNIAEVSTSTGTIIKYQSNSSNSSAYNSGQSLVNKNNELELKKLKCETERLRFEINKMKLKLEQ